MRKALDGLYGAALVGACVALAAIAAMVFVQVAGRVVDRGLEMAGMDRLGVAVPSLAEIGGFLFVGAVFLALPGALRAAGHVRVTLLLRFLGPTGDRVMTVLALLVGTGLACFATWYSGLQTIDSFEVGSVSFGLIAVPLWIPQAVMTLGLAIFVVALVDELAATLAGRKPAFREAELAREIAERRD